MTSCSFFSSAPCSGGMSLRGSRSRSVSGLMSSFSSSFSQSSSSDVEGFFFRPGTSRSSKKIDQRLVHQLLLDAGKMHVDDLLHGLGIGELDVVKEAAAQKGVGQLLLVVGGDEDDGPPLGLHRLAGLVDMELHAVELLQKVVGKLDVRLVDLVDEQHRAFADG